MTTWIINGRRGIKGTVDNSSGKYLSWNITSPISITFTFGGPNDIPLVGDWTGSGSEGIGAYDPRGAVFYLKNALSLGLADYSIQYGTVGETPISWYVNGINGIYRDSIGIITIAGECAYLNTYLAPGDANVGVIASQMSCPSSGTVSQCTIPSGVNKGLFAVRSIPSRAKIYIDGSDTGFTTPFSICGLSSGSHNYRLTLSGYNDYIGTTNIIYGTESKIGAPPNYSAIMTPSPVQAGPGSTGILLIAGLAIGVLYLAIRAKKTS